MTRALIKLLASLALATGLAFVVAPATPANAAPAEATVAAKPVAQRATTCAGQRTWVARSHRRVNAANKAVRRATHNHKAPHHAKKVRAAKKRQRKARAEYNRARRALAACVKAHQHTPVTTSSPIQALCDNGVPQQVCDALAGLIPSTDGLPSGTDLPISQLCSLPGGDALCGALSTGSLPDPSSLATIITGLLDNLSPDGLTGALGGSGLPTDPTGLIDTLTGLLGGGLI